VAGDPGEVVPNLVQFFFRFPDPFCECHGSPTPL
jgi:hypothetical protein